MSATDSQLLRRVLLVFMVRKASYFAYHSPNALGSAALARSFAMPASISNSVARSLPSSASSAAPILSRASPIAVETAATSTTRPEAASVSCGL